MTAHAPSAGTGPERSGRRRWLQSDEGWKPGEDATRLLASITIAAAAVALKLVIVGVLGGELGYLSYLGAVALGAWIAGLRGGAAATLICAVGQALLFTGTSAEFTTPYDVLSLALFLVDGAIVTLLSARLRRAYVREQAARAAREADLDTRSALHQAAERNRAALTRLQAVTASLAGAVTPGDVATAILDRGLAALGAVAGGVSRLSEDGRSLHTIAVRGYPDYRPGATFALDTRSHVRHVVESGEPVFLPDPKTWTEQFPESPPHVLPTSPAGGAIAVLPLAVRGRTLGTVVFRFAGPREFDAATRDLAVRLAEQGALALDRALAHDDEVRLREALERGRDRLALLVQANDLLAAGSNAQAGISALPGLVAPGLADWCALELLETDPPGIAIGGSPDAHAALERLAAAAPRSLGRWLVPESADRGALVVTASDGWSQRLPDALASGVLDELGTRALLAAPVINPAGELLGSLVLGASDPARFGPDDVALAQDLARRVAAATERSSLFAAVTRFKATVDASADAVYMFDPGSLRLTYVNRGGADLVGYEPDELLRRSVLDLQANVPEESFRARVAALREKPERAATYPEVLARRDGTQVPVDVSLQDVTLGDGSRAMILTARDISDRIDVQARLARIAGDERRQAAELRAVIQAMGEGVLVIDPSGRISMANDAAAEILGADLAAGLADVERQLAVQLEAGATHAGEGTVPDDENRRSVQLEDGRWIEVATYTANLTGGAGDPDRPSRIVVVRDVTRARDAEAAREAFLGVLSHELRTPVTTIFGYAKVLRRPSHHDDQAEMLSDIETEADRLYRIVEDLLALSRVEAGMSINGEPVLVQHVIGPVVQSEAQRWEGIEFDTRLPRDLPAVYGDRTYVEQVLRNLVSNAGKYSPPGTTVTVEAEEAPGEVVVRVLDRGMGIDPEEADRLFELYYRSPGSAQAAAGAGIGLYVGRGLIAAMGGRIWARPRPGGGSEFGFSLPLYEEEVAEAAASGAAR